jgi:Ca2+-binding RTX toxin-like protein
VANNFADRILLSGLAPSTPGSNIGATGEVGEPTQSGVINSDWWSWTAPHNGTFSINTKNSNLDTYLSIFTGSAVNNLTVIGQHDDYDIATGDFTSLVTFHTISGTTYQIAIDGYSGMTGNFQLNIVPVVINGTPNADILTGSAYAETINGLASNDKIDGGAGDDTLNGNDGDDTLNGNDGNDRLDGGPGADRLTGGGLGRDTYIVDNVGDVVVELPDDSNNAIDLVESSITYTLPAEVESLTLTGSAGVHATGNDLQNNIRGNFSNNILNGSSGNDVLDGSDGNDALLGELEMTSLLADLVVTNSFSYRLFLWLV